MTNPKDSEPKGNIISHIKEPALKKGIEYLRSEGDSLRARVEELNKLMAKLNLQGFKRADSPKDVFNPKGSK